MTKIYDWFGGRSTFFAFFFFAVGCVLAFHDKLSVNYVALAGSIQTLIAVKSVSQDYHERQCKPRRNFKYRTGGMSGGGNQ